MPTLRPSGDGHDRTRSEGSDPRRERTDCETCGTYDVDKSAIEALEKAKPETLDCLKRHVAEQQAANPDNTPLKINSAHVLHCGG